MTYRALYRVFRPSRFSELVGQETVARTLLNAQRQNRLSHAYLFCGARGTGKTSTAKILAKAVNCREPDNGEPCNRCANCTAINEDRYLDVIEIDAASNRGIDEMRNLRENVRFAPTQGPRKVYIIDEVHMLTTEAFNALLKTLEEPPGHVLFILATTDPQKIPPTILSRTQRFDFRRISEKDIRDHLTHIAKEENLDAEPEALALIAESAAGGMRDAVSLLDQSAAFGEGQITAALVTKLLGRPEEGTLQTLFDALLRKDYPALFEARDDALAQCGDNTAFLQAFIAYLRRLFMAKIHSQPAENPTLRRQEDACTVPQLEALLGRAAQGERDMRTIPDTDLILEVMLIDMTLRHHPTVETAPPQVTAETAPPQVKEKPLPPKPKTILKQPEDIKESWQQVMKALKIESVKLHAFMAPAEPIGLDGDNFVIRFPKDCTFHHQQMLQPENLTVLKDVLNTFSPHPFQPRLEKEPEEAEDKEDIYKIVADSRRLFGSENVIVHEDRPGDINSSFD